MDKTCVLGCFLSDNGLQMLLLRLKEMRFEDSDISLIAVYGKLEHLFSTVLGPLKFTDLDNIEKKISHLGFDIDISRSIKSYLNDGGAIAVVACDNYQIEIVIELFNEFNATRVEVSE